jgi:hypothetical protein
VFWGTLAGLLVKKVNMEDLTDVQKCCDEHGKNAEEAAALGIEKQASAPEVMEVLKLVGEKITEGAKAFLYKEYIWLTIWSCSFGIVLGSTVDLLEMNMTRAPTNFPYTATSYLTGSMTSILAGYIGMRIAVYTNTRVTFTCCSSVHRGFITAFRGGQVLGFCLVGLAILNIMIIILLFKACWYNAYLDEVLASGRPINRCPDGDNATVELAQSQIWTAFESQTYAQWARNFKAAYPLGAKAENTGTVAAPKFDWNNLSRCVESDKCNSAADTATTTGAHAVTGQVYMTTMSSVETFRSSSVYYTPKAGDDTYTTGTGAAAVSHTMTKAQCDKTPGSHFPGTDVLGAATNACYTFVQHPLCDLW